MSTTHNKNHSVPVKYRLLHEEYYNNHMCTMTHNFCKKWLHCAKAEEDTMVVSSVLFLRLWRFEWLEEEFVVGFKADLIFFQIHKG